MKKIGCAAPLRNTFTLLPVLALLACSRGAEHCRWFACSRFIFRAPWRPLGAPFLPNSNVARRFCRRRLLRRFHKQRFTPEALCGAAACLGLRKEDIYSASGGNFRYNSRYAF